MKNRLLIYSCFALFSFLLSGCKVGNVASTQGLSDQAYLYFVSNQKYSDQIEVTVDRDLVFKAKVVKEKKYTIKGNTYAISTGKHHIKITYRGQTLYERELFLSTQETKKIALP